MTLVSWRDLNPFTGLSELQRSLDRLLENPGLGWNLGRSVSGGSVFPPINIFVDREGALIVRAEVPGIDPEKLDISIEPERLTIAGERASAEDGNGYHRRERRFGRFSRSVQLPADLDPQKATAEYRDGLLTLRIEKNDAARPRKIEVKAH